MKLTPEHPTRQEDDDRTLRAKPATKVVTFSDKQCPRVKCHHAAASHRTRPGGLTAYCIECSKDADRGWRQKTEICYLSATNVLLLNEVDTKVRRQAQMAPVSA